MTLTEIKEMFIPNSLWSVTRHDPNTLTIHPNVGDPIVIPPNTKIECRTILQVKSKEIVFQQPDGSKIYTQFPKASQVQEAHDGYLHFIYQNGVGVKMQRLTNSQ